MRITEETTRASTAQRASVHDSGAFSPAQYCIVLPANSSWMTLLTAFISEKSRTGTMNRLKNFRRLSLKPFHTFQAFSKRTVYDRVVQLKSKTKRSKNYDPPIAMLPDDVLIDIFVLAAMTLEDKVAVSLVCRRFRGVVMSMREMWDGYWIESDQTPEQIIAIAEGNGFTSLKARIKWSSLPNRPFGNLELIVSYIPHLHTLDTDFLPSKFPAAPSLRSLDVRFVPPPPLSRRLTRFRLSPGRNVQSHSLPKLLDFLSSSDALEEFSISVYFSGEFRSIDELPVVTMPSVVSCEIKLLVPYYTAIDRILVAKLRMPILRSLKLAAEAFTYLPPMAVQDEFRASLQSMSSLEDLELKYRMLDDIDHLDEIIRYAPPHLESFSLKEYYYYHWSAPRWNTSHTSLVPNRKLIHFRNCTFDRYHDFSDYFIDYLREVGLGGVKLQFSGCEGWRDGTFGLDDVMSAWVGT